MEKLEYYGKMLLKLLVEYSPKVITAFIMLVVGWWLIKIVMGAIKRIMKRRDVEITLQKFLISLIGWALKAFLFIMVVSQLGIQTSSFVAIIGAAGLAVGLALQGSLSNFAGGVLILLFKPFKVGDFIEAKGIKGTVKEIGIFTTNINTFGNELAIIPNGQLSNDNVINYSAEKTRRNNIIAGISYESDIRKAKSILLDIVRSNEKVLQEPAPEVYVAELADSSVNLSLRYWTLGEHLWEVHFYTMEQIKLKFDENGIEIPYPHQVEIQKKS